MIHDTRLPLTFWLNVPSHHQADMLRALVAINDVDLKVVLVRNVRPDRVALGWQGDTRGYPHVMLRDKHASWQAFKLALSQKDRVHIVNGIWAEPALAAATAALRLSNARYLNYAEVIDPLIIRSRLKTIVKHSYARVVSTKKTGFLAISKLSRDYHLQIGFSPQYTYEFGYFLADYKDNMRTAPLQTKEPTRLLYVGQLIHRKGIDLLIKAVSDLLPIYAELSLELIGDGGERAPYEYMAKPFANRIHFAGVLPFEQIRRQLADFHALVLPSRHDGWGVVVNEALSVGVPVIVSDACGAADLVQDGENGYIFAREDMVSLRSSVEKLLSQNVKEHQAMRNAARETGSKISTEVVAPYLIQCIRHVLGQISEKPIPPWKE